MKAEAILWTGAAVFYAIAALIYFLVAGDAAGVVLFGVAALFGATAGLWSWRWWRKAGNRAEDVADATMADNARELGYFPQSSVWPFGLALGATLSLHALIFGTWLALIGAGILVFSGVGLITESMHKA